MKKIIAGVLILLTCCVAVSHSEMRLWTDRGGNAVEAEYVSMFAGKVVLRTPAGKQIKVPVGGLCDEDQEYLKTSIPPEIETKVYIERDTKTLDSGSDYTHKSEKIRGKVTLRKTNRDPSSVKYTAQLFLFTKKSRTMGLVVLDKFEHEFTFEKKNEITFISLPSTIKYRHFSRSERNDGEEYEGYLLVVLDEKGKLACSKGSHPDYEAHAETIREAQVESRIDSSFNVIKQDKKKK